MTLYIDNIYFEVLYGIAAVLVLLATAQTLRYARRHPSWGSWTVAIHFAAKSAFIVDLFLLRSIWWTDSPDHAWGGNGVLTFAIRLAWVGTFTAMMAAVSIGAILPEGDDEPWDGGEERRSFIRRAADREHAA